MKILYFLQHHGYLKGYEATLRLLLERGHSVRVVFDLRKPVPLAERLSAEYPTFSYAFMSACRQDDWERLAQDVRTAGDYLRYFAPVYRPCSRLRQRVQKYAPATLQRLLDLPLARSAAGVELIAAGLRLLHRSIPSSPALEAFLEAERPDLVLVNPMVDVRSPQAEYVRSAQALGYRTALCVNSWDNLTNRGLIWGVPDRVFVWNEVQKRQATELHRIPPERVVVTGAQTFDDWFDWAPSSSREAFARKVGLAPDQPFILYLCSSKFVAPDEPAFVERWIEAIRASDDPALRAAGILIRPHAGNPELWRGFDAARYPNTAAWPPLGASPIDDESKADYYDSMFHSAAAVGVNTSAMIEAGIVGRPVHTIRAPEFAHSQDQTLHFQHLLPANGGLLHVAGDLDEHLRQLSAVLAGQGVDDGRNARFVESFVRPHGLKRAAGPILADEIEQLGAQPAPRRRRVSPWLAPLGRAARTIALAEDRSRAERRSRERAARRLVERQRRAPRPAGAGDRAPAWKLTFVLPHEGFTRNLEPLLRLLGERGHDVHLAFESDNNKKPEVVQARAAIVQPLCDRYPNVTAGRAADRADDPWSLVSVEARRGLNYLRYLEPRFRDAPKLRARAEGRAPARLRRVVRWPLVRTALGRKCLESGLRLATRLAPDDDGIVRFLEQERPDLLVVIPLVELDPTQAAYVRAARTLGIRTALVVHSWDNLTNKGLMHEVPDFVTVWNEAQKREAVELHGVPPKRVVVTGASPYDHWFDWAPGTTREEFCGRVGLDPKRPFLLYVGSSSFIAPDEARFVVDWLGRLRAQPGGAPREAGVLIRPHPQNATQWQDVDLSEFDNVAIWPRGGASPIDDRSRGEYYDSIYHSAAVVGVNTSAQIESAILGRPVHTLLADEFRATQEGTLHFRHLTAEGGGLLRVAATFEEHAAQLAESLGAGGSERRAGFVEAFVRPGGLDVAATPKVVAAIEQVCGRPAPRPVPRPAWARLLASGLAPLAADAYRRANRGKKPKQKQKSKPKHREARVMASGVAGRGK